MIDQTAVVQDEGRGPTRHMFSAEASTLGWRPGECPAVIVAHGRTFTLKGTDRRDGDVQGWQYAATDGAALIVFND